MSTDRNHSLYKAFIAADQAFETELHITYGTRATRYRYSPQPLEPVNVYKARAAFHAASDEFFGRNCDQD